MKRVPVLIVIVLVFAAACSWAQGPLPDSPEIEHQVNSILSQMTTEEKIDLLGGVRFFDVRAIPRLNLPALPTADGPVGVRNDGPATVMAGGIGLAATWDPALAKAVGVQLGRDARAKGKNFLLGPGVNIYRAPLNGRNFEYFGEDPFLASHIAVNYIEGVQSEGVSATIKHFLGNNSEFGRHKTDSIIDERTLREIYLPVFKAAVQEAHVGAVMDSYNLTNGQHMTENPYFNNEVLKKEWGFSGILMSDWGATYSTIDAANGGLDLEMPFGKFFNRADLLPAIQQGKVSMATLDDKVRRILRMEIEFGWRERPQQELTIPRDNQEGGQVALHAAEEAMVLLKNDGGLLPLDRAKIKTVALIGPDAYPAVPVGGGSAQASAFHAVSFLEGLTRYLGPGADVLWDRGLPTLLHVANATEFSTQPSGGQPGLTVETFDNGDLSGTPASTRIERHFTSGRPLDIAALSSGEIELNPADFSAPKPVSTRWTGYYTPVAAGTYDLFVQQGGFDNTGYKLYVDGKLLADRWNYFIAPVEQFALSLDAVPHKIVVEHHTVTGFSGSLLRVGILREGNWTNANAEEMARKADAVVLAVGFDPSTETEGSDRTFGLPPGEDELIRKIAGLNPRTIVVITSGGGVDMNGWLAQVPALLEAWYPGQEGGTALPEILFGDVDPSGHLPVSFERRWEDNPAYDYYYPQPGTNRIVYKEGIFTGYRGYEHNHVQPLFPFGYGLSYTRFKFSHLEIKPEAAGAAGPRYEVTFEVENTGSRPGATVAQVYVEAENAPVPWPRQLKGFARVDLKAGESRRVTVPLDGNSFSYYDVNSKAWQISPGKYEVSVGGSSAETGVNEQISIGGR